MIHDAFVMVIVDILVECHLTLMGALALCVFEGVCTLEVLFNIFFFFFLWLFVTWIGDG